MAIKVYISGISGNKEVKKRQQRVIMILDSKNIKYEVIDIAEPGSEEEKDFMQNNSTANGSTISDPNPRHPLPPQIFNDKQYCGDYDMFDMANEIDEMEKFLKLTPSNGPQNEPASKLENGDVAKNEKPSEEETKTEQENEIEIKVTADAGDAVEAEKNEDVKESSPVKEASPVKEPSPVKESSPEKADE